MHRHQRHTKGKLNTQMGKDLSDAYNYYLWAQEMVASTQKTAPKVHNDNAIVVFGDKELPMAQEEKPSSNRKYSLDNSDNRRYSVSRITGTQKDELFRQVSSHLSSYIDEQVAKGRNLADLLEELASEHSSHREKLLGGYRATARDFEARKDDKEHRQTVVGAHWPEAKTWTENREAKIKEAYDLFASQIKEVVDYAGVLYREIVIDRERASRNPEGGIQLHSWRDAERQRAEREAGTQKNRIRPTSRSEESGFSIARSMDELKAEVKEAFPGAKVQESGSKLIFTMPNGQKVTFTFHESVQAEHIPQGGERRDLPQGQRHRKGRYPSVFRERFR